jgi:hypothetical protein
LLRSSNGTNVEETVGIEYDNTYKVSLEDPSFGNVSIEYVDNIIETRLATEDEKMFFAKKVFGDDIESLIYENR